MGGSQSRSRRERAERGPQPANPTQYHNHPQPQQYPNGAGPPYTPSNGQQYLRPYPPPAYPPPGAHGPQATPKRPGNQDPNQQQQVQQTSTVKNLVNLKKATLQVVPVEEHVDDLRITFDFDCSAACSVTTFVCATEDAMSGRSLTTAVQAPAARVHFSEGLGQSFESEAHVVKVNEHTSTQLMEQQEATWPLIIRMETVTEQGSKDGHSLDELQPGSALPLWVQAQMTYAVLEAHPEDPGRWAVKVVKQKIVVEGVAYELQEIYGVDKRPKDGSLVDEGPECIICMTNERDTTVLPCRHMCMCSSCAKELLRQSRRCPICRKYIVSMLQINMPSGMPARSRSGAVEAASSGAQNAAAAGKKEEEGVEQLTEGGGPSEDTGPL